MNGKETCQLQFYSQINASEVKWLWYPCIPFGKITLVQGDLGDGKTTLMLHIASLLSQGDHMPFSKEAVPPGYVLYQSAEDNPSDTIEPRLLRENANCDLIAFLDNSAVIPLTLTDREWERAIRKISARFLRHLGEVAECTKCAIVLVGHMNKAYGGKGLYRGLGSIDIVAAARSVLAIGRSKDDQNVRVLAQIKNSLAKEGAALAYELTDTQGMRWIGEYDMPADDILYGSADLGSTKLDTACVELKRLLSSGNRPCNEIYEVLESSGISKRTIDHAKKMLSIISIRQANEWHWSLAEGRNSES